MKRLRFEACIVVAIVLCAVGTEAQPSVVLVGINDLRQSEGVDQLIELDPNTGVGSLIGSLGDEFINCEALTAVAFLDDTTVHMDGLSTPILSVDDDRLLQINPITGIGNPLVNLGFSDVDGIAFLGPDLYGVTYGSNKILRVRNLGIGVPIVEEVADDVLQGHRLNDIAFFGQPGKANGPGAPSAFILTDDTPNRIYRVDPLTGANLHRWIISGPTSMESLVPFIFDGSGAFIEFLSAADRDGFKDLVLIRLATDGSEVGTATFLSAQHSGFRDIEGLAWLFPEDVAALRLALDGPTDVVPEHRTFVLHQNLPNPFNPTTRIAFELDRTENVELAIYDVAGHKVVTLMRGELPAGPHAVSWNGRSAANSRVAAGTYRYTLRGRGWSTSRNMVLVK